MYYDIFLISHLLQDTLSASFVSFILSFIVFGSSYQKGLYQKCIISFPGNPGSVHSPNSRDANIWAPALAPTAKASRSSRPATSP